MLEVRLKNDRYLTSSAIAEIKKKVGAWIGDKGEFCLRDCKEALDFNRSLDLPVLEYLDGIGFTIKRGERRVAALICVIAPLAQAGLNPARSILIGNPFDLVLSLSLEREGCQGGGVRRPA